MSVRTQVLLWAQRVVARKGSAAHLLLEISEQATADQVQEAFHKIARTSHPDLHRTGLNEEELELVTTAYAAVAGAYAEMRNKTMRTQRMRPITHDGDGEPPLPPRAQPQITSTTQQRLPRVGQSTPTTGTRTAQPSPPSGTHVPVTPSGPAPVGNAEQKMSSKALLYYRKAELCLKRGDLKGAILQLKLACAADPTSTFLRTALIEVENEVRKGP